ncbi:MAG: 23S rRNA (uracil(1939)-C(5))-methyltransferase RlmD, partial [Angelakisella sp.]
MDQIIPKPQNENSAIPTCKHAKKCGGCQMQNMPYPQQLRWKQIKVERLLEKFQKVSPILGMKNPLHYRNKVQAAFGIDMRKRIVSGVYQSSSHRIVPVDSCMIEDQKADEIIVTIRGMLTEFKLLPYNEDTGRGFLRHVLVKRGFASGEIMVVLVTGSSHFPSKNNFIQVLRDRHPDITTIVQNVNAGNTSLVLGEQQ